MTQNPYKEQGWEQGCRKSLTLLTVLGALPILAILLLYLLLPHQAFSFLLLAYLLVAAFFLFAAFRERRLCEKLKDLSIVEGRLHYRGRLVEKVLGRRGFPVLLLQGGDRVVMPLTLFPTFCSKLSEEERRRLGCSSGFPIWRSLLFR